MEEIEIQCVYLRRRENQPDEYDRRIVKCTRRERILQFRSKVAEAFQISPTTIKLINRGKLVELNPILSLIDVEIDQSSTVHVLDLSQKAPSMSRRRPQSAATPFLPHSTPEMPNVIRMANARSTTLTELSVNRYCMNFVYTEALCPQEQLDAIIRSLAESFRNKYNVDVDVQRRNGQPFEGDITFDVAFRAPAIMPSGAYNRYEAIKTLLIRQKLFITVVEKHLIDKIQNPQENSVPSNFDEIVLQEMDRVETMELFCNNDYFSDDVSNAMMNEFVSSLESEVNDEVPLLGNVLQIRHLVPTDYYNILDMSAKLDQEAYKLTNLQRTLFNSDQTVDPKVADLFTVLLRRIHHLQAHIQHIFSEISLRTNDSLRVAYPQGVLSTFSGLNPDITLTITFMTTTVENRNFMLHDQ
uniref:Ubiquitin-like domain-containing protein n=1 Tax=Panagrolaimus davidi TaxID=227884 RepID=A0A914QDF0_9BILA